MAQTIQFFKGTVIKPFLNQKRSEDRSLNGSKTVQWQIKPFNDSSLIKYPIWWPFLYKKNLFDDCSFIKKTICWRFKPFDDRSFQCRPICNWVKLFLVFYRSVPFLDHSVPWLFRDRSPKTVHTYKSRLHPSRCPDLIDFVDRFAQTFL